MHNTISLLPNDQKCELGCFIPAYYTANVNVSLIVKSFAILLNSLYVIINIIVHWF